MLTELLKKKLIVSIVVYSAYHNISWFWVYKYSRLNVCVSPKFTCWTITPSVMLLGGEASGKWSDYEGVPSWVGCMPQREPCPPPCRDSVRRWPSVDWDMAFTRHWISCYLIFSFPPSPSACEKYISVVYTPLSLCYCYSSAHGPRQVSEWLNMCKVVLQRAGSNCGTYHHPIKTLMIFYPRKSNCG